MFTEPFMQRALLAAILLAPLCALLGVFVTARKLSFFSETIAHGALAGVGLGFWWGLANPTLTVVAFSLCVAAAVLWLKENTELLTDTILAVALSGSVSIGIILLTVLQGYQGQIQRYLFGDILAIGPSDLVGSAALFAIVGVGILINLSPLALLTTSEDMAHVCGVPLRRVNYLFVLILAIVVAMTIRLLGIILVTSLIVIPPAAARNLTRNFRQHIVLSLLVGLLGGLGGVTLAYRLDTPCGPTIVLTCIVMFLLSLGAGWVRSRPPAVASP
jgi:ABC-type Mn2+/Zn2+ transport system permease subunit